MLSWRSLPAAQVEHHTVVKLKKRGEHTKFVAQVLAIGPRNLGR